MQAGKLRHRVTFQSPQTATDPFQSSTAGTWNDVLTCWASIDTIDPREVFNNGLQNTRVSHVLTIRYPGIGYQIGSGYQAQFGTRVFQIVAGIINEEERNRQLQLFAWETDPTQGGQVG